MQPGIYSLDMIRKFNIRLNETPGASYQDNGFFVSNAYKRNKRLLSA